MVVVQPGPMFGGIDEAVDINRSERRAGLARIDNEFAAKGLYRSGPRIKASATELARSYEQLALHLFDIASKQPATVPAYQHVIDRLRIEFDEFRTKLIEIVTGINGGDDALRAALQILESAREQVDGYIQGTAARRAEGVSPRAEEHSVLLTEDGDTIVTEDGDAIVLEGDVTAVGAARVTEDGDYRVTADGAVRRTEDDDRSAAENVSLGDTVEAEIIPATIPASGWTGRLSAAERVHIVRTLAPVAQIELQDLIDRVAEKRFNGGIL